jgi:nucleoside-diphosphate-sugar epimerase
VRALVTGARGFVGSWLTAHLLESGDDVVAIDHEVEITDGEAVRVAVVEAAPDVVYHLAALTNVGRSWTDPAEVLTVNAMGTLYVLEAARVCALPPAFS